MMFPEAQRTLEQFLSPLSLDEFLDRVLAGGFRKIEVNRAGARTGLLGADPESALLAAWQLAPTLTFHSANPSGPAPSLESMAGAADFQQRIAEFHARNYSVRFPDVRPLSPDLDRLCRALEMMLHKPVTASALWSRGGMRAPIHYDDHDLLVVHLRGTKRWYVSQQPSELRNTWSSMGERTPDMGAHQTLEVQPGDLMYLPRGTYHSVSSDASSLHVSIGFTPLTVREVLIAAIDHLSDLDRGWRTTMGGRIAYQLRGGGVEKFTAPVSDAAAALLAACRTQGFVGSALQARSGRAIAALTTLPPADTAPPLTLDSELVQNELAFCHLTASPDRIDVSYPGGHLYVHRGVQPCVEYIVNAQRFRVRNIPGEVGDDIRLSLAARFVEVGFLRLADSRPQDAQTAAA
jgi:hypothetical protein